MALTKDFKQTVQERAARDPEFRVGLLEESVSCLLAGDIETGKILLRDYINATMGFEDLATLTHKSPKSLMRMVSPEGNPTANNLFAILGTLQKAEGIQLGVHAIQ